jgi:hypothetical protein
MKLLDSIFDKLAGGMAGVMLGGSSMRRSVESFDRSESRATESLIDSEMGIGTIADLTLAAEDVSWRDLSIGQNGVFTISRRGLRYITNLSRLMFILNPLIRRAVTVQELYVWGSGVRIKGEDDTVTEVLNDFFNDPKNQRVIGESWPEREREQRIDGNTFLVLWRNKANGASRVRLLPVEQVEEIICNPDDSKEPWFYIRGAFSNVTYTPGMDMEDFNTPRVMFPDIDYDPINKPAFWKDGTPIKWDAPVLHIKTGGLSGMRFGMPELYSALNWATGYKRILENFATILQAYARMAMKMTGLPGKKGVAAAKSKLGTGINNSRFIDNNPPTNTASWAMLSGNVDVSPIRTAGSTTGPDEARALRSMVASGTDTPEHFFGDSDIGNFATSSTLDRPTELKMVARQRFWMLIILHISNKLMEWSARAPLGKLRQAGFDTELKRDQFDGTLATMITAPEGKSLHVSIEFDSILERDVTDRVRAVVQAATLGGSPAEGIIPDRKLLFKLLMTALGEKEADFLMNKYYPDPVLQGFADPADRMGDEHLTAQGRKELGDAAILQAKKPPTNGLPKPSGSPKGAVTN